MHEESQALLLRNRKQSPHTCAWAQLHMDTHMCRETRRPTWACAHRNANTWACALVHDGVCTQTCTAAHTCTGVDTRAKRRCTRVCRHAWAHTHIQSQTHDLTPGQPTNPNFSTSLTSHSKCQSGVGPPSAQPQHACFSLLGHRQSFGQGLLERRLMGGHPHFFTSGPHRLTP